SYPSSPGASSVPLRLARRSRTAARSIVVSAPDSLTARRSAACADSAPAAASRPTGSKEAAPAITLIPQKSRRLIVLAPCACYGRALLLPARFLRAIRPQLRFRSRLLDDVHACAKGSQLARLSG